MRRKCRVRFISIKILLALSLISSPLSGIANEFKILVRPPSASAIGFEAYLRSEDKVISLSTHQLSTWIPKSLVNKTALDIESQLKRYTSEPGPLLVSGYRTFLNKAYGYNWPLSIRKSLAKLWLRTYELETEPLKKAELLDQLGDFFPSFQPSFTEFSPPILAMWKQIVQSRAFFNWRPLPAFKDFRYLIINGKVYRLSQVDQITLPENRVHITAFSDLYLPVNRILTGQQLRHWQPPKKILVRGLCEHPYWHPKLPRISNLVAYFGNHCLAWRNSKTKQTVAKTNLMPSKQLIIGNSSLPPTPIPKVTNKKKWGWIVFVGLATGLIGYDLFRSQQNQKNNRAQTASQPISHHGF